MFIFFFLLLLLSSCVDVFRNLVNGKHKCAHDEANHDAKPLLNFFVNLNRRMLAVDVPLTLYVDSFYYDKRQEYLVENDENLIPSHVRKRDKFIRKEIMDWLKNEIMEYFSVDNVREYLSFGEFNPEDIVPPTLAFKNFRNLACDLIVILANDNTSYCDYAIAYASPIARIQPNGRPILGLVNLCPVFLNFVDKILDGENLVEFSFLLGYLRKVLFHELFHVLGFSPMFFGEFGGVSKRPIRGHEASFYDHPTTNGYIRSHFGCFVAKGAELEDFGENGTVGSHLDSRIYHTELMDGSGNAEMYVSEISLSILESSGWYKINYAKIPGDFIFGKDKGCAFLEGPCLTLKDGVTTSNFNDFCVDMKDFSCKYNRAGVSFCLIHRNLTLKPHEQFFKEPDKGGILRSTEGCPVYVGFADCSPRVLEMFPIPEKWKLEETKRKCIRIDTLSKEYNDSLIMNENNETLGGALCEYIQCDFVERTIRVYNRYLGTEFLCRDEEKDSVKDGGYKCPPFDDVCREGDNYILPMLEKEDASSSNFALLKYFFISFCIVCFLIVLALGFKVALRFKKKLNFRENSKGSGNIGYSEILESEDSLTTPSDSTSNSNANTSSSYYSGSESSVDYIESV